VRWEDNRFLVVGGGGGRTIAQARRYNIKILSHKGHPEPALPLP